MLQLLGWTLSLALGASLAFATQAPRFLIFHVDAVAASDFDRALADGRLPNVERAFADGMRADAVTLFFASTPVIYPRMHSGASNSVSGRVGFGGFDRAAGRPITEAEVFLELLEALPRRAATNLLHGIPLLDGLAGAAMQNLPDLLERYRVVEFFWFSTDTFGHLMGEDQHARSLERFDAYLGRLLARLDCDDLNLILYTDHGLTFTREAVDLEAILEERVGDARRHFAYPNLYLNDPRLAPALARRLTSAGGVDYAFYRVDEQRVEGFVDGAFVRFEANAEGIRYVSTGDPLRYAASGYDGAWLTPDEWLTATIGERFPAVPPNVFGYLQNPNVGDVVMGVNPPRIPLTVRANHGNHAGLVDTDLVVPVLWRGPDLDVLADRSELWLHELYRDLPAIRARVPPVRERHEFEVRLRFDDLTPAARLRVSPAYRLRLAAELEPARWRLWSEHDVFATYLVRFWLGAGVTHEHGELQPLIRGELEFDVGDARLRLEGGYRPSGWEFAVGATFRVGEGVRVSWLAPGGVGLGFDW